MTDVGGRRLWHQTAPLVPLVLLSGAWTTLMVSGATATADSPATLPDATELHNEAIHAPASLSAVRTATVGSAVRAVSPSSTNGIPGAALAAYQRAATVINAADPGCHIGWPLIAAIGRVESDHGRYGDRVLSADGVARPGIFGVALNGRNGTARIADTDAGNYDGDARFDRAVGPMQFIPSTWSVVGVDGDGDKIRNPQDVDDAALAAAVYLCSGDEDLSTDAGVETAVYRYNHSRTYVALVKQIAEVYGSGGYSSVPTSSYAQVSFGPAYDDTVFDGAKGQPVHGTGPGAAEDGTISTAPAPTSDPKPAPHGGDSEGPADHVQAVLTTVVTELQEATSSGTTQLSDLGELVGGLLTKP
jgi:hypothetical protein